VDGIKKQLLAVPGRIKEAGGSKSSITAFEQDVEFAQKLVQVCVTKPAGVEAALKKARDALNTAKILLQP
jgi:hypothetical protein